MQAAAGPAANGAAPASLAEIGGSIDLDEVLARTLEAAGALKGVDAALVSVGAESERPIVATLGLSEEEARRQAVSGPPDGREARSIAMSYRYANSGPGTDAIHSGVAVPLRAESGPTGFLTIFTRARGHSFDEADVDALEALAARAGPAIDNARRFREARQLADLDALTGLHNRRYFHETLEREVARAQRYNRRLALLVFDLDDFKSVNDRIGHLAGDAVLAEAADRVREVVRTTDVACRVGGDEFAIILPESTLEDADQLYLRLRTAVSSRPVSNAGIVEISVGVAEMRPSDEPRLLFERADSALYRAKETGKARMVAAGAS
jgi:diguanylate cyclase (GGDEF)-like protein